MLKKRIIVCLTFLDGVLFRTKLFKPDYRYTKNFIDMWSIDEIVLIDITEKKFSDNFIDTIKFFTSECFVPLTIGGGIKKLSDADKLFKIGADKVLLGSHSIKDLELINKISHKYGNQAIIQSLDCKKNLDNDDWSLMINSGQNKYDNDILNLAQKLIDAGAGEILINSIDNDGSLLGYDISLIKKISRNLDCPVIALGGGGNWSHMLELFKRTDISGVCTQNIFHFTEESIISAKNYLKENGINIRT